MNTLIRLFIFVVLFGAIMSYLFLKPLFFGTSDETLDELEKKFFLNNTTMVYNEQSEFRDKAVTEYKLVLSNLMGSFKSDSIFRTQIQDKIDSKYLIPKVSTTTAIPLNNYTDNIYFLVGYDTLFITHSIDKSKIDLLVSKKQNLNLENILRYQDCYSITKKAKLHLRLIPTVLSFAGLIIVFFLISFIVSINDENKKETKLSKILKKLSSRISSLLSDNKVNEEFKDLSLEEVKEIYSKRLKDIQEKLSKIDGDNLEYFIIENLATQAESKMKEVASRSNLMLGFGLVMAFVGVVIFYFTLPNNSMLGTNTEVSKIILLSIRPTLILLFIEGISWYLLNQHKNLQADYKYYHAVYNKKLNYLASFKLMKKDEENKKLWQKLLPLLFINEEIQDAVDVKNDNNTEESGLAKSTFKTLLDKILDKF
jgi:hypothetical protein